MSNQDNILLEDEKFISNIDIKTEEENRIGVNSISEYDRLIFAKQILLGLALICIVILIAYGINPENKAMQAIFDFIKVGALPIVTLIIGFYFKNG
ncbi:MAG: hypothetical protein RLZZ210_1532 [Pseudomonadota bacterium]|jgi:hypothetical protein